MMKNPSAHVRIRPRQKRHIDHYIEIGEFETVTQFVEEAVSHHLRYLEERDFRLFVQSEEGKEKVSRITACDENKYP